MLERTGRDSETDGKVKPAGRKLAKTTALIRKQKVDLGPLGERLGYFLRRAQIAVFQDFGMKCRELDIRPVQYSILTIIEHNPGLSQTQVAHTLGIKKTNLVAMLDTLEKRGLVRRAVTQRDRRTYALFLSDGSKAFMRRLHKLVERHERGIVDLIGADMHRRMFEPLLAISKIASKPAKEAGRARPDDGSSGPARRNPNPRAPRAASRPRSAHRA
jgi:DNA-binding MarR family transcriptional regulator